MYSSDAKIARKLGVTRQYVGMLRREFKIPSTRSSLKSRDFKIALAFEGKENVIKISKRFNLSESYLYKIKRKYEKDHES